MSFLNGNDIDCIAKIENKSQFARQTAVISEYFQARKMM